MNWQTVERFITTGQAILPINSPGVGDSVRLVDRKGQEHDLSIRAESFLKQVLTFFGTDPVSLRRRYGQVIGKKKMIPLPLSQELVLIPFNTRIPIGRQSRTGWIVTRDVKQIEQHSAVETDLHLSHYTVRVYHSHSFCLQQLRSARLIQYEFEAMHRRLAYAVVKEPGHFYSE